DIVVPIRAEPAGGTDIGAHRQTLLDALLADLLELDFLLEAGSALALPPSPPGAPLLQRAVAQHLAAPEHRRQGLLLREGRLGLYWNAFCMVAGSLEETSPPRGGFSPSSATAETTRPGTGPFG